MVKKHLTSKILLWNMSFCDPQIDGVPKSEISIEIFQVENIFFPKNLMFSRFIEVSIRSLVLVQEYLIKISVVFSVVSQA